MEGPNMNRREFLRKAGGAAALGAAAAAGSFGGVKLERASGPELPAAETDPQYVNYLAEVQNGNQEVMRAGLMMAEKFQEGVASNAAAIAELEKLISISTPQKRSVYEMAAQSLKNRVAWLQIDVAKFADPVHAYYEQHKHEGAPSSEQEPPPEAAGAGRTKSF